MALQPLDIARRKEGFLSEKRAKVLMIGWEYPPHIAGGLGTACEGLTKGLAKQNVDITFIVPELFGGEAAPHMHLIDKKHQGTGELWEEERRISSEEHSIGSSTITKVSVPTMLGPYLTEDSYEQLLALWGEKRHLETLEEIFMKHLGVTTATSNEGGSAPKKGRYGRDIFEEVAKFTADVIRVARGMDFDVIHAHDWMTYPAAVALKKLTKKPLISHIHSLEYDRSGENVNHRIQEYERLGLTNADAVIAVSHYTKTLVHARYGVDYDAIHVVHNGIYPKIVQSHYKAKQYWPSKVVLFLGRVTFQKGPDYFVRAAAKVVQFVPDVTFIMAGSGDMLPGMIELADELGVRNNFHFTGFLNEKEVEEVFSIADLYIMPSVSEPFGISALEAIDFETPAIISKQSGVAEVLSNSLKFDFWDTDRLADLIINGLLHDELREDIVEMAKEELKNVRWDAAAVKTKLVYDGLLT